MPESTPPPLPDFDEAIINAWYERKSTLMEAMLGPMHDSVLHSIIGFPIGGPVHLYFFPNTGHPGTAMATKELSDVPGQGASNARFRNYELAMFTRQIPVDDQYQNKNHPFGKAICEFQPVLTAIGNYALEETLNVNETLEFPRDFERLGGRCFIFDAYEPSKATSEFGLMLIVEIHRAEMEFAMQNGGAKLISMLKSAGYWPYSDMDRKPVLGKAGVAQWVRNLIKRATS